MRLWQSWSYAVYLFIRQYPPRFIEVLMLLLAMSLLLIWGLVGQWPYLVLSLSYVIGSSISVLVREFCFPSYQPRLTQLTALVLLVISLFSLADLARYL
jgi:hypothetical protein